MSFALRHALRSSSCPSPIILPLALRHALHRPPRHGGLRCSLRLLLQFTTPASTATQGHAHTYHQCPPPPSPAVHDLASTLTVPQGYWAVMPMHGYPTATVPAVTAQHHRQRRSFYANAKLSVPAVTIHHQHPSFLSDLSKLSPPIILILSMLTLN